MEAITGGELSTYTLGDADVGTVITVVVRYTDGQGTMIGHQCRCGRWKRDEAPVPIRQLHQAENTPLTATLASMITEMTATIDGDLLAVKPTPVRDASHAPVLNADGPLSTAQCQLHRRGSLL